MFIVLGELPRDATEPIGDLPGWRWMRPQIAGAGASGSGTSAATGFHAFGGTGQRLGGPAVGPGAAVVATSTIKS